MRGSDHSCLSGERGWERLLVSGEERLADPLADALPPALGEIAVPDTRMLAQLTRLISRQP